MNDAALKIVVDSREYPCYPTLGSCLRFTDKTGKEVAEIKAWQTSLQCVWLWCCVKAACEREKMQFDYECQAFCDNVPLSVLQAWIAATSESVSEEEGQKKSPSESANS